MVNNGASVMFGHRHQHETEMSSNLPLTYQSVRI